MALKLFVLVGWAVILQQILSTEATAVEVPHKKHIYCLWDTSAAHRQGLGKYEVSDIDPSLCTHIAYASFSVQETGEIQHIDAELDLKENGGKGYIKKLNELKQKNTALKTMAAVDFWHEGAQKFSIVANDPERRKKFVQSVIDLLLKFGFNGLDLHWEHKNANLSMPNDDKANFVTLLKELKEAMSPHDLLLAASVAGAADIAKASYNIPEISKYLDLINVIAFGFRGHWDSTTGHNAPLYPGPQVITPAQRQLNIWESIEYWTEAGAPREKLLLGIPFYGNTFKLANASEHGVGAPSSGPGIAGKYAQEEGTITYMDVCEGMQMDLWEDVFDIPQGAFYAYTNDTWISYEDTFTTYLKSEYARDNDLGGVMVYSLENDDFRGICGDKYPLLTTVNEVLQMEVEEMTVEENQEEEEQ